MEGVPSPARHIPGPPRSLTLAAALLLAVTLAFATVIASAPTSQARAAAPAITTPPACDAYTTGRHIYDCAGLLTPDEISGLEAKAQAVQNAGAPVVVYLQVKDTSYDQTLKDAADLMARWNVESKPGAKDGLVILLNLKPGDLRHGQVALYAGQTQLNGALPQSELSRIYEDVMLPDLSAGQTASGIGAGLDAAAADLRRGGPPPTPAPPGQDIARAIGTIPFTALSLVLALMALVMGLLRWRRTRDEAPTLTTVPTVALPTALSPAVAGALITGKVSGAQMEATILDFARRGMLQIEPLSPKQAQIRLLSDGRDLTGYERALWEALVSQTTQEGSIPPDRLYRVASGWGPALALLKRDLFDRGWFDADLSAKRRPLIILMAVCFVLILPGAILGGLAQQVWPFLGALLCFIAGMIALSFALAIPAVTPAGREVAQSARNYLAGLSAQLPDASASEALPWLIATGQAGAYRQRLNMEANQPINQFAAIYPYWLLIHTSMAPPASHAGSVAGATGAAAGGGGAGGSF